MNEIDDDDVLAVLYQNIKMGGRLFSLKLFCENTNTNRNRLRSLFTVFTGFSLSQSWRSFKYNLIDRLMERVMTV